MVRGLAQKTIDLIEHAYAILQEYNPMTLRQVYYQLVSRKLLENKRSEYQRLSNALVRARQEDLIPWDWIEDRVRRPLNVHMWENLPDFLNTVRHAYRKNTWQDQPAYIEVWLEKDALSGIFADITEGYGVTLVVGRGYNSWSAYNQAARRFQKQGKPVNVLYFGDFDPSGEDILRALDEGLNFFGTRPVIEKVALTMNDIERYDLPPDFTKKSDTRAASFVRKHGDIAVELDALPLPVLQEKIKNSIESSLDLEALNETRQAEQNEKEELTGLL